MDVKYDPIESFRKHMEDKIEKWSPFTLHLGDDFAVFEFNYKYQCTNAHANLKHYQDYYGYKSQTDGNDRLVIIAAQKGEMHYDG